MENDEQATTRGRGRPRGFDREDAVDRAMHTFWTLGYDDASISLLADAMGIRSASLYAAFGDKAGLFREAVALYGTRHGSYATVAFAESTARACTERLLHGAAKRFTDPMLPPGCLVVLALSRCSDTSVDAGIILRGQRMALREAVKARLDMGIRDGETLPAGETGLLAEYIVLIFEGLSTSARQGSERKQLDQKIAWALGFWPQF